MFSRPLSRRKLADLDEREVLALAIANEETDRRLYLDYALALQEDAPESAEMLAEMARVEDGHRRRLLDLFRARFGDHIPLIRREDIAGFQAATPLWRLRAAGPAAIRRQVERIEDQARAFYESAAAAAQDADVRQLLGDLAAEEAGHVAEARRLSAGKGHKEAFGEEDDSHRRKILLQIVQPGLAGLMDGSVSTLAPLFAAAFATQDSWNAFLVGMAASIGAGISMGFAEALSDDGALTGRGSPIVRGFVTGLMTVIGGVGHTLPYLIDDFRLATLVAVAVVAVELLAIAWIRWKWMQTPFFSATLQIVVGGALVFAAGILIGSA